MKKVILSLLALASFSIIQAQYWQLPNINAGSNPGGLNNDIEGPAYSFSGWVSLLTTSATPTWSAATNIPFAFSFNGSAVTQFKASSTGIVTFDVGTSLAAPSAANTILPNANIPNNSICIWGIQGTGTNDKIVTKTFGTAPNRQFWIQYNSYSIASNAGVSCYWSIVLEETTNQIHIVDHLSHKSAGGGLPTLALTAGLQISSTSALNVAGSPSLNTATTLNDSSSDNTYYSFIPGTQPVYDLTVTNININQFVNQGNNYISGSIRNLGTSTITSMTMNYKINNGTTVSAVLSGLNIPTYSTYNFTHTTPWNATTGNYTLEAYATLLNGSNADANTSNDKSTKSIIVLSELVQRIPLFEVFTSSTNSFCLTANANFHSIVDTMPKADYVAVKFQQNFPGTGDPYATAETVNRFNAFYANQYTPIMKIDGGWGNNTNSFSNALYYNARAIPAQYKLTGTYAGSGQNITAKVKFSPLFSDTGAKVYVAILEKSTINNVKTNGETIFYQVAKKMLPSEAGTSLPAIAIGTWDSLTMNYTFNGNYKLAANGQATNYINNAIEHSVEDFSNLYVVAWIQGADKKVYQAVNLTPMYIASNTINLTTCNSYIFNNQTITQSGTYYDTLINSNGSANITTLNLTINNSTSNTINLSACNSYIFNNQTITQSGIYYDTLINSAGCDSIITLNLTIKNSTSNTINQSACNAYTFNNQTITQSGIYYDTLINSAGCDSIITLNLTIKNSTSNTINQSACNSYTFNYQTITTSGIYYDTLINSSGCDSIITLNLTIKNSTSNTMNQSACNSYNFNNQLITQSGTYYDTLINAAGCDSIITLNLTIKNSTSNTINQSACNSYNFNNQLISQSGIYLDTLINSAGCDSIITLNLTIKNSTSNTINQSACNSFNFNNQTITQSGIYYDTLINSAGCDSIITLNLTIKNSTSNTINQSACNSYTFNNQTITQSGIYYDTLINSAGCDSIITLNLTIKNSTSNTINQSACNAYTFNNQTITQSGIYYDTLINSAGCDSIITLNLTINTPTSNTINQSACNLYTFNNQTITVSGIYYDTLINATGCDSIITLNLTINSVSNINVTQNGTTLTASNSAASYQWVKCNPYSIIAGATNQSYTATANGDYAVILTENACTDTSVCVPITNVSVKDIAINRFTITPNPATNQIAISANQSFTNASITIYSITGQTIFTVKNINSKEQIIDISKFANGVYYVEMKQLTSKEIAKFIKQ
jgi:hypothetical protein